MKSRVLVSHKRKTHCSTVECRLKAWFALTHSLSIASIIRHHRSPRPTWRPFSLPLFCLRPGKFIFSGIFFFQNPKNKNKNKIIFVLYLNKVGCRLLNNSVLSVVCVLDRAFRGVWCVLRLLLYVLLYSVGKLISWTTIWRLCFEICSSHICCIYIYIYIYIYIHCGFCMWYMW